MQTNEITNQLKNILLQTGRPKTWAAREMNVSYPHFHAVLNGKRVLSSGLRLRIIELMNKMATSQAS